MDLLFKLLLLPLAHAILTYYMSRFRAQIKKDDIVGVEVGEGVVLNRKVYVRFENSILALNYEARSYVEYPLDKVFTRDHKFPTDVSGAVQNLL